MRESFTRRYTMIIAYTASIGRDKIDLEITKFQELIQQLSGKIEKSEYLGEKPLAYEINKQNKAHYVQYYFKLNNFYL